MSSFDTFVTSGTNRKTKLCLRPLDDQVVVVLHHTMHAHPFYSQVP